MEYIAIFHPEGNIANNPHLSALVRILNTQGYAVDIFSRPRPDIPYQSNGLFKHIRFFLLPPEYFLCEWVERYVLVIGVDDGLVYARNQAELLGVPYAHISYELLFDDELAAHPHLRAVKNMTRSATHNICFAIIQDDVRAELYMREYKVSKEKIVIMPVAGADVVKYQKCHYLHSLFKLPPNKKILLHIGSLATWSMTDWLLAYAHTMPENWVLVLHGRYGPEKYATEVMPERVYFTEEPAKNFEELQPIVQSADCCAALYQPEKYSPYANKNIQFIGLASGKFSTALQHGVSVLVRQKSIMGDLIREYGAGITIDIENGDDLSCLEILNGFDNVHTVCHKLFTEKLSLNNFTFDLFNRISRSKTVNLKKGYFTPFNENGESVILYFINNADNKHMVKIFFYMLKAFFFHIMKRIKGFI